MSLNERNYISNLTPETSILYMVLVNWMRKHIVEIRDWKQPFPSIQNGWALEFQVNIIYRFFIDGETNSLWGLASFDFLMGAICGILKGGDVHAGGS